MFEIKKKELILTINSPKVQIFKESHKGCIFVGTALISQSYYLVIHTIATKNMQ